MIFSTVEDIIFTNTKPVKYWNCATSRISKLWSTGIFRQMKLPLISCDLISNIFIEPITDICNYRSSPLFHKHKTCNFWKKKKTTLKPSLSQILEQLIERHEMKWGEVNILEKRKGLRPRDNYTSNFRFSLSCYRSSSCKWTITDTTTCSPRS